MRIIVSDRYSALGIPRPDPKTMCLGPCEGTGFVPVHADETDPQLRAAWQVLEDKEHDPEGWHFVTCPICKGSRLRKVSLTPAGDVTPPAEPKGDA